MPFIDVVFFVIIFGFALFGLWFGLVHTIGSLLGTIAGAYLASRWYEPFADILIGITGWNENLARVIMFVVAFLIINRLVGFAFWMVDKVLGVFTHMPFIRSIDRFLGLFVGFFEGLLTLGLVIFFIERFPIFPSFMERLADSKIAPYASAFANYLMPLLPDALRVLRSSVDYVENIVR
ncbi:MAG: CvpA family protein [Patescibacteria group bacterium]